MKWSRRDFLKVSVAVGAATAVGMKEPRPLFLRCGGAEGPVPVVPWNRRGRSTNRPSPEPHPLLHPVSHRPGLECQALRGAPDEEALIVRERTGW